MQRIAIIDLGTNTFNLLIAENDEDKKTKIIYKNKIPAQIGKGGFADKKITPKAFARGLNALKAHKCVMEELKVFSVYAFATSALRDASNRDEFLNTAYKETGIVIKIISGKREAELIYKGVNLALDIGPKPQLIMDIGGGSTEFIIANNKKLLWVHSFDLGVSRIWEKLKPSDPLSKSDNSSLKIYLDNELTLLFSAFEKYPFEGLIGSSGSFESLAKLILVSKNKKKAKVPKTSYSFKLEDLQYIQKTLIKSNRNERTEMKGLVKYRIDTIPLAAAFTAYIIQHFMIKEIRLSTYALREGVMSEIVNMA